MVIQMHKKKVKFLRISSLLPYSLLLVTRPIRNYMRISEESWKPKEQKAKDLRLWNRELMNQLTRTVSGQVISLSRQSLEHKLSTTSPILLRDHVQIQMVVQKEIKIVAYLAMAKGHSRAVISLI